METSINIARNVPLASYTTFKIGGNAEYFCVVKDADKLCDAVSFAKDNNLRVTVLGGGSNVVIADEGIKGMVIKNEIEGVSYEEKGDTVLATVGAGVSWDAFVLETVEKDLWGIENLSGIPGTVGATPIQNVGAYGVEVRDVITTVHVLDIETLEQKTFTHDACQFAYRDSLFKHQEGKRYIVTAVAFTLSKIPKRVLSYKDLAFRFESEEPSLSSIREAILEIRNAKFPNLKEVGTAGSFFKNPFIAESDFEALKAKYPEMPGFPDKSGSIKVPLGWILEHVLHLKGFREGNVGTYAGQALVVVNFDDATAHEVDAFAKQIEEKVFDATNIKIEREVNFIS